MYNVIMVMMIGRQEDEDVGEERRANGGIERVGAALVLYCNNTGIILRSVVRGAVQCNTMRVPALYTTRGIYTNTQVARNRTKTPKGRA